MHKTDQTPFHQALFIRRIFVPLNAIQIMDNEVSHLILGSPLFELHSMGPKFDVWNGPDIDRILLYGLDLFYNEMFYSLSIGSYA